MKPTIYIDGQEGTTGLQIVQRLQSRSDITVLSIAQDKRKDCAARAACMRAADVVFLCLPDAAAREAVTLVDNPHTRIIDASTAHRVHADWTYGFAELHASQRQAIATAKRVANPGCHATGFIAAVAPLTQAGLLPSTACVPCVSLTGYSGGGKAMIAQYQTTPRDVEFDAPRLYGLSQQHKHLPEMQQYTKLAQPPLFTPIVADFYSGMASTVQLAIAQATPAQIHEILCAHYAGQSLVTVAPLGTQAELLPANAMANTDGMKLVVCGKQGYITITALFDNLGKGASGAAVQNMNIMLGLGELTGLSPAKQ